MTTSNGSGQPYLDYLGNEHVKPADVTPRWRISAYALVIRDGKCLLVKQMGNPSWELPGGGIELIESLRDGVVREAYEETGYRISVPPQPLYVGERNFYGLRDAVYFKNVMLVFRCQLLSLAQDRHVINTIVEDEISHAEWVALPDVSAENCHPMFWPVIEKIQQQYY